MNNLICYLEVAKSIFPLFLVPLPPVAVTYTGLVNLADIDWNCSFLYGAAVVTLFV